MKNFITNENEYAYQLSLHETGMLLTGMIQYFRDTEEMGNGREDKMYCSLRMATLIKSAKKLQEHISDIPAPNMVKGMNIDLDAMLEDAEELKKEYDACWVDLLKPKKQN
jgi:uncharacterized protein YecA (UPF0149 family)